LVASIVLLKAVNFDHHTTRELDLQLDSHVFIFNMASRKDGAWGAIARCRL
jgi:hypothetical protein